MRILPILSVLAVVGISAGACGDAYDEERGAPAADSGATLDGAAPDGGADSSSLAPPPLPSRCPFLECKPDDPCDDETCTDPNASDFVRTGSTTVDMGECAANASAAEASSFHIDRTRNNARARVTLAFRLHALDTTDRVVASVSSAGESWQIRARGTMLELCELNGAGLRCAAPIAVMPNDAVHLYGISSPSSPPGASFALSVNQTCSPDRVLDATAPFGGTDLRGTVGCLGGTAPCSMRFDDALFAVTPE